MPRYYRRIIRIKAEDSPNVQLYLEQLRLGVKPTLETILPGVLSAAEYVKRRSTWDKVRQCIGLDGAFWEGADTLLYPPQWLNLSRAAALRLSRKRRAKAMGVDPAEGGDKTTFSVIDKIGLLELVSIPTPDTSAIYKTTLGMMKKWRIAPEYVAFDRGGGGKQIADMLNENHEDWDLGVRSIPFGEAVRREGNPKPRFFDREEEREEKYEYLNRRAQMYWELSEALDPSIHDMPFAIPEETEAEEELRRQMALIPKTWDGEGRAYVLSKNEKKRGQPSLKDLIGHSPDELDSLVLAYYALKHPLHVGVAGAL